ncbi:MAG: hypothetical protein JW843_03385, partial [Candidatus Aminicenantes bacterium]|nr:hypothetical protein [Candidatus Aminicenantes bacterium]
AAPRSPNGRRRVPMPEWRSQYRDVKKALRKGLQVDAFFVGKFAFSPYQACAHGCLYCDGRAERYWVEGEFDRDIVIRRNAPQILAAEVPKLREKGIVFIGSGISDGYQPPEKEEKLMPACGRILAEAGLPAAVLTKSSLVLRDLDIWSEVQARSGFTLMVSLITLDDRLRAEFEPGASPVEERLEALSVFRGRGCSVGVAAMPLLPSLCDGDGDVAALADRLAAIGVDFVLPGGLTLRPGRQKDLFLSALGRTHPELLARYEKLYEENRASGAPLPAYSRERQRRMEEIFKSRGLPIVVPHGVYRDRIPLYDEIDVLIRQLSRHYASSPKSSLRRLEEARARYQSWLLDRKKFFNRRRRMREEDLTAELKALASAAGWAGWLGNPKLAAFLREVIIERRTFDELSLQLRPDGPDP